MKKEKLLSVGEVAKLVGVSKQAIYKRISTDLQPFVQLVENKKFLKIGVLEKFESTKESTKESTQNSFEKQIIDMLQNELDNKNKQISEMQKLLDQEQQLRMAEHKKVLLLEEQNTPKKGLFRKRK